MAALGDVFARLVTDFAQQAASDFLDFHQGALGLTPVFILHSVGRSAHRFQAFVGLFEHPMLLQFFLMVTPGTLTMVLF